MSKFTGCSSHIQLPAAASLQLLNAAALWVQPVVMNSQTEDVARLEVRDRKTSNPKHNLSKIILESHFSNGLEIYYLTFLKLDMSVAWYVLACR